MAQWIKCLLKISSGLVGFCGISTVVGYIMPYPVYTNTFDIWLVDNILKRIRALILANNEIVSNIANITVTI